MNRFVHGAKWLREKKNGANGNGLNDGDGGDCGGSGNCGDGGGGGGNNGSIEVDIENDLLRFSVVPCVRACERAR